MAAPSFFGPEIHVNTTTRDFQDSPSITALANGKFVAVWKDASGDLDSAVRGQVFNADGSTAGGEFLVNQTTSEDQLDPVVTALADGRFVVAWTDFSRTGDDTSGGAIRARIFNVDGAPAGDEFLVNTVTNNDEFDPAIAALANGGFVISWTREFNANDLDIRARAFDSGGIALGDDFRVDDLGATDETQSAVVGLANGNYVIVWEDEGSAFEGETDGSDSHIRALMFSGNGTPIGSEFIVNSTAADDQEDPAIALLSDGNFVVTWTSDEGPTGSEPGIRGRLFSPTGAPLGADFLIENDTESEDQSSVSALANGEYVVAWSDGGGVIDTDGSVGHIRGRLFTSATASSDEFVVNTTSNGNQREVRLTTLADGRFVAIWTDNGGSPDDDEKGVRAQIFDPRTERVNLAGTGLDDDWVGTVFGDIMNGGGGNDSLAGGLGGDLLFGAEGDDRLDGGAGNDLLNGFRGADRMIGGDGNDSYIVDDAGDLIIEEASDGVDGVFSSISLALPDNVEKLELDNFDDAVNATGNALANILIGNAAANVLDGGAGADRMTGGLGDDTYVVDDPGDAVLEDVDAGIDAVLSSVAFALGAEVENLTLTGLAAIDGIGNALANVMIGNDAGNVLSAAAGNDVVDGGFGADAMAGGLGDDVYVVDQTGDAVFEASGEGFDAVFSAVAFTLGANLENLTLTGAANAAAKASAGGVNGTGNAGANTIVGSLSGNRLDGGAGNDALIGQAGRDALLGGKGNDLLGGGLGKDLLAGGKGKDQFLFDTDLTSNFDKIADFSSKDTILLDDAIFTKLIAGKLAANAFFEGSAAHDANDRIIYDRDSGALFYDRNGDQAGGLMKLAVVEGHPDLTRNDFFVV